MPIADQTIADRAPRPEEVGVVLPVYNEACSLGSCLEGLLEHLPRERILVVDDGSSDDSAALAEARGVEVLGHFHRQGKGAALRRGFEVWALRGAPWVLSLDADGQHETRFLPAFLQAARGQDLVLGDRLGDRRSMPLDRRLSNALSTALLALRCGQGLRDSQCGFRLYRTKLLQGLELKRRHFDLESEVLLKALLCGARVTHTPITCIYGMQHSGIHRLRDSLRFAGVLLESLRPGYRCRPIRGGL